MGVTPFWEKNKCLFTDRRGIAFKTSRSSSAGVDAPAGIGTVSQKMRVVAAASSGPSLRQLWMKNTSVFYSVVPYANTINNSVSRKNNRLKQIHFHKIKKYRTEAGTAGSDAELYFAT
jgi:hypothetical protein